MIEEKFEKIKNLFKQRALIDEQIKELIAGAMVDQIVAGVEVDPPLPLTKNGKKKKPVKKAVKSKPVTKNKKTEKSVTNISGQWSKDYEKCVCCKTTNHPHRTSGFCNDCFTPKRVKHYKETGEIIPKGSREKKGTKSGESKWSRVGQKKEVDPLMPKSSSVYNYSCRGCGHNFQSVYSPKEGPDCPECGGVDVMEKI